MANNLVADDLLRRMGVTAGSSFIASERLRGRERKVNILIAIASSAVIGFTIAPLLYHISSTATADLDLLSITMSVLIVAIALLQYSTNDAANAEQLHRCALEINELHRELKIKIEAANVSNLSNISKRYGIILQKYSINHATLDFDRYRVRRTEQYTIGYWEQWGIRLRFFVVSQWPFLGIALIVLLVVAFFFLDLSPARNLPSVKSN
jgi:hypothetical protein